jgi:GNAT superfamily N-acetyltransferase
MGANVTVARAGREELDLMVDWAAAEGWNPGRADADCFFAADPDGFWLARVDGEAAACLSIVTYVPGFTFLGFYIAHPDHRGRGIGHALWQTALDACPATTIGLDGVVAQQDNYRKSGFVLAHRNVRHAGAVDAGAPVLDGLVRIGPGLPDAIAAYDRGCFAAPRRPSLDTWLGAPGHVGYAAIDDERIAGYGVVRPCRDGWKIGPLFADDAATAERLLLALAAHAEGTTVILDPPEPNGAAADLCRRYRMAPVFETARMYRGPAPALPLDRIFGITTFELG